MITRPMLSGEVKDNDLSTLEYPLFASPKIDGIRCLRPHGMNPVTRNFKKIPNKYINGILIDLLPEGFDGEIILPGKPFNETVSGVMSIEGKPEFKYWAFDYVSHNLNEPFYDRMDVLRYAVRDIESPYICEVNQRTINSQRDLEAYESSCLSKGYEGVMIRKLNGRYKCGRSTANEGLLLKLKRFKEDEAIIIGYEELLRNNNPAKEGIFGLKERSTHKDNKIGMDMLGAFTVLYNGLPLNIGSGLTMSDRQYYWTIKDNIVGKTITFKYQPNGSKDKPRFPVFKGFREDI